jgi:hypothetical protein
MKDQGVDVLLILLFGAGGIILLVLAWTMPLPEKIMSISVGLSGLLLVLMKRRFLKRFLVSW